MPEDVKEEDTINSQQETKPAMCVGKQGTMLATAARTRVTDDIARRAASHE